jgi:phosphohistidine phosphatase
MIIHLIRHAEAIERTPDIAEDHRYLTRKGRNRFRKVAVALRKSGAEPDLIFSSPLIRAVQTAEILSQALKFKKELVITPLLAHGFTRRQLDELLEQYPKAKEIALVGHEPELGEVTAELLATGQPCSLDKGATVSLKLRQGSQTADFRLLMDGTASVITSQGKALKKLLNG